jgi:hypothetical protein
MQIGSSGRTAKEPEKIKKRDEKRKEKPPPVAASEGMRRINLMIPQTERRIKMEQQGLTFKEIAAIRGVTRVAVLRKFYRYMSALTPEVDFCTAPSKIHQRTIITPSGYAKIWNQQPVAPRRVETQVHPQARVQAPAHRYQFRTSVC